MSYDERPPHLAHLGGQWILSAPETVASLWGDGDEVAWAVGEVLMIAGADGTGKTALAHNLMLRLAGIIHNPLLGLPVKPRDGRILYLAQDRPVQARRALRRMVGEMDLEDLDETFRVIDWPLGRVEDDPEMLKRLAGENEAQMVVVDALKDIAGDLRTRETGKAVEDAYKAAIADGVDVCLLHHDRKASQDGKRRLLKLSDVYGDRFMVAGCGSVLALNGGSGDPVIEFRTLKQVIEEIGPFSVQMNFTTGEISIYEGTDLVSVVHNSPNGLTANDAARILYDTDKPTRSDKERARRKLQSLVDKGLLAVKKGTQRNEPDHYVKPIKTGVHGKVHAPIPGMEGPR